MSGYKHPSWKWEQWEELWPLNPREHAPFNLSECSSAFQRLCQSDADVLTVMTTTSAPRQVSLASIRQLSQRLARWMQSPIVEDLMTLPPSVSGFHRAIAHEIEMNTSVDLADGCFATALLLRRPGDVARALEMVPEHKLSADWQIVRAQINFDNKKESKPVSPTVPALDITKVQPSGETSAQAEHSPSASVAQPSVKEDEPVAVESAPAFNPANSARTPPRVGFSDTQKFNGQQILKWATEAKNSSSASSVQKEMFDGLIKQNIFKYKGVDRVQVNSWLEEFAIGALATLNAQEMRTVLELWPSHKNMTFNDPQKVLSESAFWQNMRRMNSEARACFMQEVLPQIVDASEWSNEDRYRLLPIMVAKTDKYDWIFEERLKLWLAWGGNLSTSITVGGEEGNAFSPTVSQSAQQWLREQNHETWNTILERYIHKPRSGLSP